MARYRWTLISAVLFVGLLAWVLTNERGRVKQEGEIFGFDAKLISKVDLTQGDQKLTLERRGDDWWVSAPIVALCDKDKIDAVLKNLIELKPKSREKINLDADEYGLKTPSLTVAFVSKGANYTLTLGTETGIGSETFAKVQGAGGGWDSKLLMIPTSFKTEMMKKPDELRDKKLARYDREKDPIASITLEQQGQPRIVAEAAGKVAEKNVWRLTEPIQAKGDEMTLSALSGKPAESEALGFEPMPQDQNLAPFGLDKPTVKLTIALKSGKSYTMLIGAKTTKDLPNAAPPPPSPGAPPPPAGGAKEVVYAMREGRPEILLMDVALLNDCQKDVLAVRDKHVLALNREGVFEMNVQRADGVSFVAQTQAGKWRITSPKSGDAKGTKIDDLLYDVEDLQALKYADEAPKDLKQYGLSVPQTVISLKITGLKDAVKVSFGYQVGQDKTRYYCQSSLSPTVYEVSNLLLDDLPKSNDDLVEAPGTTPGAGVPGAGMPPMTMPGMPKGAMPMMPKGQMPPMPSGKK